MAAAVVTNPARTYQFIINIRIRQSAQPTAKFKKSFRIQRLYLCIKACVQRLRPCLEFRRQIVGERQDGSEK